jgi:hypothetical protein
MWRFLSPAFQDEYRVVLFDLSARNLLMFFFEGRTPGRMVGRITFASIRRICSAKESFTPTP